MSFFGGVFGYFSEATNQTINLWGNQSGNPVVAAGTVVNALSSKGSNKATSYGDQRAFTFTNDGLPWFRIDGLAVSLNASRQVITHTAIGASLVWDQGTVGGSPYNVSLGSFGGYQKFYIQKQSADFVWRS